jgi:hypothetical protein
MNAYKYRYSYQLCLSSDITVHSLQDQWRLSTAVEQPQLLVAVLYATNIIEESEEICKRNSPYPRFMVSKYHHIVLISCHYVVAKMYKPIAILSVSIKLRACRPFGEMAAFKNALCYFDSPY